MFTLLVLSRSPWLFISMYLTCPGCSILTFNSSGTSWSSLSARGVHVLRGALWFWKVLSYQINRWGFIWFHCTVTHVWTWRCPLHYVDVFKSEIIGPSSFLAHYWYNRDTNFKSAIFFYAISHCFNKRLTRVPLGSIKISLKCFYLLNGNDSSRFMAFAMCRRRRR